MPKLPLKKRPPAVARQLDVLPVRDEIFLQPWFIPKDIYLTMRSLLPSIHLLKMRYYFEDFGCLRCERNDVLYGSNGLCEGCSGLIRGRVKRALQRRLRQAGIRPDGHDTSAFTSRMLDAQRLLRDFMASGTRRGTKVTTQAMTNV